MESFDTGKLGFVGIAKGFPLGGSCLRSRLMRGRSGTAFRSSPPHPVRFAHHLPLKGKASTVSANFQSVILSAAKDLKTPASTTTMRIVGHLCCKILQSLCSLRMTRAAVCFYSAKPQLIAPFPAKQGAADGLFRPSAAHREKEMKMKKVDRVLTYQLPWPPLELPLPPKK